MLRERIRILYEGNVISKGVKDFVDYTIDSLEEQMPKTDEEKLKMFTTHLAMATQRISEGKIVDSMDELIWEELLEDELYQTASDFYETIMEQSPVDFPTSEKQFLILHIRTLLDEDA